MRFFFCLFMLWVVSAACQEQSWVMRQDGEEWRVPSDSSPNQSQQNRCNDESHTMEGDPLIVPLPSDSPSPKTPWPNFNVYTLCAIMYLLVRYGWAGIWLNIAQDDLLQMLCPTIIICQNVTKCTWKRQNECMEIAKNFCCRAQQKELDAKWSTWIMHKSGWTSSGDLVFVSSSEKKQDFMHNAFIVLTPALIVPNNALQPKRKATLDASASGNSSICWTLALVIQSACLYVTQSRQEPQHVHFRRTDSK